MSYTISVLYLVVASTFANTLPISNKDKNWRVIGGETAADGEYPHVVSIKSMGIDPYYHKCGGSIVHQEWVITAAHCVGVPDPSYYKVLVGSNKLNGEGGSFYDVTEIYIHDLYDDDTALYDVAILKVEKIKFTDKVDKIKLEKTFVGDNVPVTLTGWGVVEDDGEFAENLQRLTYNTTTVEECRKRVPYRPIEDIQICTLHRAGVGGCVGDSGSPAIRSVDGIRYVVGIISYGPECGSGYYPDVFGRVSSFVSWFNSKCNCNL